MVKISKRQATSLIIFGVILSLLLIEFGLRTGGVLFFAFRQFTGKVFSEGRNEYRILCLGESMVYDGGVYSYPSQLERILNGANQRIKFKIINRGVPGITSKGIVEQLEDNLNNYNPHMVIVMIGINDNSNTAVKDIISTEKMPLLKRLRIYKLWRVLKINIINTMKNSGIYKNREDIAKTNTMNDDLTNKKVSILRREIEKDPANYIARSALMNYFKLKKKFKEMEETYKYLIEQDISKEDLAKVYADLARFYQEQLRSPEIEKMYKTAIKKNPEITRLYCELGIYYRDQEKYRKAEDVYNKAMQIEPTNSVIYDNLGDCYKKQGRAKEAEEMYEKARSLHPGHVNTFYETLGKDVRELGKYDEIERIYRKILEIDPNDTNAYFQLGKCYEKRSDYASAEKFYKKNIEIEPSNYKWYGTLALFYQQLGDDQLSELFTKKANSMKVNNYYSLEAAANYLKLKESILRRKIRLVCAQYPLWDIDLLKTILGNCEGCIFIDNNNIFKNSIKQRGYETYFIDRFAGDFGHCSKEGNRLLASNIADIILKEAKVLDN